MPGRKKKQKVIPHCYRRTLSKTLSNSSISQLVQIGSYKKRINDLSRNNRHLATVLQEVRLEAAAQCDIVQDCAKNYNKILFARLKLNEMAKNFAKFVNDLEEVRGYLNIDLMTENPFTHKKGSPSGKLCKEPAIDCIEEVTEESSVNEVETPENVSAAVNAISKKSDGKKSDVSISSQRKNDDLENMEIAPILFAEDSEEKKKKSSSKSNTLKKSYDPDKGSLTPELNIDLTCLKLKRNSSRRQTQMFQFPGSRSTSRGKTTSVGKENSPEELVTPEKPSSPTFTHQKQTLEEIFKSPIINDTEEKQTKNPNSFPENNLESALDANQCDLSNFSTTTDAKKIKTVATAGNQPAESNHTVISCEDMELTEVIRPIHDIIVENGFPFTAKSDDTNLGSGIIEHIKENGAVDVYDKIKENNNIEIISEEDSQELLSARPNTPKGLNDDIQLQEINEHDEVQNVGLITFCESNEKDKNVGSRATTSTRESRRGKLVKYAVFFSSDESDADSPFKIVTTKPANKRKTVSSTKTGKSSEKTETPIKTTSSAETGKSSEKTENPIKTTSSAETGKSSEKTENPIKTISSTKTGKSSEKTENPIKTTSSAETGKSSEKTETPIKTISSTKTGKSSEKTENPIKTTSSAETGKSSEKTENPIKTISSTKTGKSSEKTENPIKTTSSAETGKSSEKTENPIKTISSTKTGKSSEKTENPTKTAGSTKTGKSKKTEDLMKTVSSTKIGKSSENLINCHKIPLEKEIKNDILKCPIDVLISKKVEKKYPKKPNDIKSSSKNKLLKQSSQKHSAASKSKNIKLNENVEKLAPHQENIKNPTFNHENVRKLMFSPDSSPFGNLKKKQPNFQTTEEMSIETPLKKVICDANLDNSLINGIETPKSESRKVSFAPTDTVCSFKRMSLSKKIAKNKKVRRTSKSILDFSEEEFEEEAQTKTVDAGNSSETTKVQRTDNPVFNFSDDTELYSFQIPSNSNFSSVPTTDDLMTKFNTSSNASHKNINKNDKHLKKIIPSSKPGKLSLRKSKDPKNTMVKEPLLTWDEISKRRNALLCESPAPVSKPVKRKSLFKEHLDGDSKENINANNQVLKKPKNLSQETDMNLELPPQNNPFKKSSSKRQSKMQRKVSTKKLSGKLKLLESSPEIRQSAAGKRLEKSPVLRDSINLPDDVHSRRRSKPVNYKEPSCHKKLRREK